MRPSASICARRSAVSRNSSPSASTVARAYSPPEILGKCVFAEHQVGQHHRGHLDQEAQLRGQAIDPVGHDHRRTDDRQFQRDGARSGKGCVRELKGAKLVRLAVDQMRPDGPRRQCVSTSSRRCGTTGMINCGSIPRARSMSTVWPNVSIRRPTSEERLPGSTTSTRRSGSRPRRCASGHGSRSRSQSLRSIKGCPT